MRNIWDKIYSDDSAFFGEDPSDFTQIIDNDVVYVFSYVSTNKIKKISPEVLLIHLIIANLSQS